MRKIAIALILLLYAGGALARDQIQIVGSSTVYPFASYVAEEFGSVSRYPTPVVESTGTGGGMKLFCSGNTMDSPDIANASRPMRVKEFYLCNRNGVNNITEVKFGYDGIVIAQSVDNEDLNISKRELLLAIAKLVPNENNTGLIENPNQYWDQVNPKLPHRKITIYGPPLSSGTRDAFEEMVMEYQTEDMKVYRDAGLKGYRIIRTDGVFIPSGENDNLIVQKLTKDKDALGIFGYSYLAENGDLIKGVDIDGIAPTAKNISTKDYPISRSLFFYIKNDHVDAVPAMKEYIEMFLDPELIGKDGLLEEIGLIPMSDELIEETNHNASGLKRLSVEELTNNHKLSLLE
jgi:phosphate transport system substrate-binding protein